MAPRNTIGPRWLTVILVAALLCSVAVVHGLIQITGGGTASSSPPDSGGSSAAASASVDASEEPATGSDGPTPDPSDPRESTLDRDDTTESGGRPIDSRTVIQTATQPAPVLPGSGVRLPAAWTGTAEVSITVLGRCATTGGTSSYSLTADLALQRPVEGTGAIGDVNPLSMTLGITPAGIPGLSILSASVDDAGTAHRSWWLATGPGRHGRTLLSAVLIADQPIQGALPPNLLSDNETDLQPCEAGRTVGKPRTLAAGSRITGWVSATAAELDVTGVTADRERSLKAHVIAKRVP